MDFLNVKSGRRFSKTTELPPLVRNSGSTTTIAPRKQWIHKKSPTTKRPAMPVEEVTTKSYEVPVNRFLQVLAPKPLKEDTASQKPLTERGAKDQGVENIKDKRLLRKLLRNGREEEGQYYLEDGENIRIIHYQAGSEGFKVIR